MKLITDWLNNEQRNYYVGKSIYESIGNDAAVIAALSKGKTAANMQLLIESLNNLLALPTATAEPTDNISDDIVLAALNNDWKTKYALMNSIRYAMDAFNGDNSEAVIAKRHEMAQNILQLEKECEAIWAQRDYYNAHGKLPGNEAEEKALPTSAIELGQLIESTKRYIRRYKPTAKENPIHAEKYQFYHNKYQTLTGTPYVEKN